MTTPQFIGWLTKQGFVILLSESGPRLRKTRDTAELTDAMRTELATRRDEIIAWLNKAKEPWKEMCRKCSWIVFEAVKGDGCGMASDCPYKRRR